MQAAIDRVMNYMEGKSLDDLAEGSIAYYGIVKNIEIIGEAAYNLTNAFRNSHKETPWKSVMSMRNILVHDYYKIKESQIRYVIEDDLTPLFEQVIRYLNETDWSEWEQNEQAKAETAVHKSLMQTAWRMKNKGYEVKEIMSITGLTEEEIEGL
jgi:uncharacterized protein with HEPN domain